MRKNITAMKATIVIASVAALAALLSTTLLISPAAAGTKVYVGAKVPGAKQVSMDRIDHAAYDALLQKYVDDAGNVDYAAWKRNTGDRAALANYLKTLSKASRSTPASRSGQLAYWINAYNAVTLHGILREYPTSSIRNHTAKLFGYNIWHDLLLTAGGRAISLDSIEHDILRKMNEPRIHFAIVCASKSCPRLLNRAYTAQKLEQQLTRNTKAFFATPLHFRHRGGRFYMSSILSWFAEDFGASKAAQLKKIAPYLPTAAAQKAARENSVSISYITYDWSLNDQAGN